MNYNVVAVSVSPTSATVSAGLTQQFIATVTGTGNTAVTWSVTPSVGTVSSSGLYTAPASNPTQQTVTVKATSVAAPQTSATATVTVLPSVIVSVTPTNASMYPSQMNLFVATVSNAGNTAVTWSMVSGPGAVNGSGWYTSPISVSVATVVTVRATSVADPTKSATATTTINPWPGGTAYQYYVSDNFSSIDSTRWTTAGTISGGASGLTGYFAAGGSVVSTAASGDGSSDCTAQMTVHLDSSHQTWSSVYAVLTRASAGSMMGISGVPLWSQGTFYAFAMVNPWYSAYQGLPNFGWSATMNILKVVNGATTILASFPYSAHDGMTMGMTVRGSSLTVTIDSVYAYTMTDGAITSGAPGVSFVPMTGTGITNVKIGNIDTTPPGAVSGASVLSSAFPTQVDLQWNAVTDENAGSGLMGYKVSRDGAVLGMASGAAFLDETVAAGTNVTYSIVAVDRHGNLSSAATKTVAVPSTGTEQRRMGVRASGSYWGTAGEQIDVLSGNLNFSLPLLSPKSRGGWGTSLMLSYNSQMWRQEGGVSWKLGKDVGYGLGWRLQAGSIIPVWYNGSLLSCIFVDATGAEYRLNRVGGSGLFRSQEGIYVTYDSGAQILYFPDGSMWRMYVQSAALEEDAGVLYPSAMEDTNGDMLS